jgi:hypothetical protein
MLIDLTTYFRGGSTIFFMRGGDARTYTEPNYAVTSSQGRGVRSVVFTVYSSYILYRQVLSGRGWGRGVRTPCTPPLDPPLYL